MGEGAATKKITKSEFFLLENFVNSQKCIIFAMSNKKS